MKIIESHTQVALNLILQFYNKSITALNVFLVPCMLTVDYYRFALLNKLGVLLLF